MEIERKFLIPKENLPTDLASYPCHRIEQGYLCTSPVVRIRRQDDEYFLTYKSKGLMSREEYNLPLTADAYEHLKPKADGILITKDRYVIPEKDGFLLSWMCSTRNMREFFLLRSNFLRRRQLMLILHRSGLGRM